MIFKNKNSEPSFSSEEPQDAVHQVQEKDETLSEFQAKIDHATMEGSEWVETSAPIIRYFNRPTLCPKDAPMKPLLMPSGEPFFFIYKGVKVCEFGKVQEIEDFQINPISKRVHGKEEGTVIS